MTRGVRCRERRRGGGEHAQALAAQRVDALLPEGAVERHGCLAVGAELVAALEQAVGAPFQQDAALPAGGGVERGHELVGRLEGMLSWALVRAGVEAGLVRSVRSSAPRWARR